MNIKVDIGKTIHNLRECEAQPPIAAHLGDGARYLAQNVLLPLSEGFAIRAEALDFSRFDEDDVEELTDYAADCCDGYSSVMQCAERVVKQPCAADL